MIKLASSVWGRMACAAELIARAEGSRAACSLTRQFVVGAVALADRAHRELDLKRTYSSAFHPIDRSPFSDLPAEDPIRALRIYAQLRALSVTTKCAAPYLLLDGRRALAQLRLW